MKLVVSPRRRPTTLRALISGSYSRFQRFIKAITGGTIGERLGWSVGAPSSLGDVLRALPALVPPGSTLYLDGVAERSIQRHAQTVAVRGSLRFPKGLSKRPLTFPHIPVRQDILEPLAQICDHFEPTDVASRIVVYKEANILVTWLTTPHAPLSVSGMISENLVNEFRDSVTGSYLQERKTALNA